MALPFKCPCGNTKKRVVQIEGYNKKIGDYVKTVSVCTKCGKEDVR